MSGVSLDWAAVQLHCCLSVTTSNGRHLVARWAKFICSNWKLMVQKQWFVPDLAHYTATCGASRGKRKVQLQMGGTEEVALGQLWVISGCAAMKAHPEGAEMAIIATWWASAGDKQGVIIKERWFSLQRQFINPAEIKQQFTYLGSTYKENFLSDLDPWTAAHGLCRCSALLQVLRHSWILGTAFS